jgi:chemotaxis receptor (MCP) glutamine deamidase CheD
VTAPGRPAAPPTPEIAADVTIYIGGVHASAEPALIRTLLGSCVAVALFDPAMRVGGMNHFMLPRGAAAADEADRTRFGVHAMDCLIGAIMKLGGQRRRLVAKVFGGAHVLDVEVSAAGVPQQNIAFIREFLDAEGFPVMAEDLGGYQPRHVRFYTATGRAQVKRMGSSQARARLLQREAAGPPAPPTYGDVTLFQ